MFLVELLDGAQPVGIGLWTGLDADVVESSLMTSLMNFVSPGVHLRTSALILWFDMNGVTHRILSAILLSWMMSVILSWSCFAEARLNWCCSPAPNGDEPLQCITRGNHSLLLLVLAALVDEEEPVLCIAVLVYIGGGVVSCCFLTLSKSRRNLLIFCSMLSILLLAVSTFLSTALILILTPSTFAVTWLMRLSIWAPRRCKSLLVHIWLIMFCIINSRVFMLGSSSGPGGGGGGGGIISKDDVEDESAEDHEADLLEDVGGRPSGASRAATEV